MKAYMRLYEPFLVRAHRAAKNECGCKTLAFSGSKWWIETNVAEIRLPSQPPIVDYNILGSKENGYNTPTFWVSLKIEELI